MGKRVTLNNGGIGESDEKYIARGEYAFLAGEYFNLRANPPEEEIQLPKEIYWITQRFEDGTGEIEKIDLGTLTREEKEDIMAEIFPLRP